MLLILKAVEVSQATYPQGLSLRKNPIQGQAAWEAVEPRASQGWPGRVVPSSD